MVYISNWTLSLNGVAWLYLSKEELAFGDQRRSAKWALTLLPDAVCTKNMSCTCTLICQLVIRVSGMHGKLITTTKCQDVVALIFAVVFWEVFRADHAMQAIVVDVFGCFCSIVVSLNLHLLQEGIPCFWIVVNCWSTVCYCCLHLFNTTQSLLTTAAANNTTMFLVLHSIFMCVNWAAQSSMVTLD